ncbi:peptidase inhibitor PI16 [Acrasis kona]|uniref:Peptidase inhibitor PI16 n=1 Tax=Acrasis kona TaxID=1008807 RepID=A0AAW2ZLY0_9EUKA
MRPYAILVVIALCVAFVYCDMVFEFSDADKKTIVDNHNYYRSMVSPAAANMQPVVWDEAVANFVKNYAKSCPGSGNTVPHNPSRIINGVYAGENIYSSTASMALTTPQRSWNNEKNNYNFDTKACSGVCGHYTQLVWAKSTKIGCVKVKCDSKKYKYNYICDYVPGGNINGGRPYIAATPADTTAQPVYSGAPFDLSLNSTFGNETSGNSTVGDDLEYSNSSTRTGYNWLLLAVLLILQITLMLL